MNPIHAEPVPLRGTRLTDELVDEYLATGQWTRRPLRTLLSDAAAEVPDRPAAVGYLGSDRVDSLSYAELDELAHRYADGLAALGVAAGDGVAVMLPNQIEFAALIFAINELGAVYTGIPIAYGEREIEVILGRCEARVLVVPESYRNVEHLELIRSLRGRLPALRTVVVADAARIPLRAGEMALAELASSAPDEPPDPMPSSMSQPDPLALCHIGFTSGTTGEPKGVMNTHQTLYAVLSNWARHAGGEQALGDPMVNLVASPVGHHTGFLWGVLLTAHLRGTAVYLDRWSPGTAAEIINAERITAMFGAPTFLQDLLTTDLAGGSDCPLRMVVLAGAPVPRDLPDTAGERFGCYVCPAWGMTEYGIGISCAPSLPAAAQRTDGVPVPGCAVRVVREDGAATGYGEVGALQIGGAGLFLGYYQRPDANAEAFHDGWFRTGDTAMLFEDGTVSLQGRSKDLIIRGGENIPVVEVESLLFAHPDIANVAVVGIPDTRLGERACAVVVPSGAHRPTLPELTEYLRERGMSTHFLPERLELVDALPMTSSGKIKKAELRNWLAD
ncbi:MAG: AMP-binding protein [Pseudonocardiaceae bacterium]|nr:AMP-binding protein [Pseudonocardiaceae bacterium]